MMVNCPKCGFSQPQDQYCASCGVDMVAYRPPRKSFLRRTLGNTVFQMTTVAVAIFVVFAYIREKDHKQHLALLEMEEQNERSEKEREARLRAEAEHTIAEASSAAERPQADAARPAALVQKAAIPAPPAAPVPAPPVAPPPANASTAKAMNPIAKAGNKMADSVRVSFIEAQRGFINELLSGAAQVAIAGSMSIGVVPEIQNRLKSAHAESAWRALDSSPFQSIKANEPSIVFKGVHDQSSGQNLGFTVQVLPGAEDEQGVMLQIDVLRVLRDAGGATEEATLPLPEGFNVPKGGAAVIAGVLPHRQLHESEDRVYRGSNVLRIMSGDSFRSGTTEAVILIETK